MHTWPGQGSVRQGGPVPPSSDPFGSFSGFGSGNGMNPLTIPSPGQSLHAAHAAHGRSISLGPGTQTPAGDEDFAQLVNSRSSRQSVTAGDRGVAGQAKATQHLRTSTGFS
jgi:hypothetical protein